MPGRTSAVGGSLRATYDIAGGKEQRQARDDDRRIEPGDGRRVVPIQWWNYVTLALSPPLIALIVATFVPSGQPDGFRRWGKAGTGAGGAAGTLAMACPVCNPLAIPIFGAAGVLSFLAPYRGVIALASIALLALTLLLRLRTTRACQLTPPPEPPPGP